MFGLNDNSDKNNQPSVQPDANDNSSVATTNPPALENSSMADNSLPASVPQPSAPKMPAAAPSIDSSSYNNDASNSAPVMPSSGMNGVSLSNAYITSDPPTANSPSDNAPSSSTPTAASLLNGANEDELIKLKQQALQSLAPLMDHLDQSAEEKFKTTMMLIQASDNAELIQEAFDAANKIEDEKVRAQALLDVVNEINYFTHHQANNNNQ